MTILVYNKERIFLDKLKNVTYTKITKYKGDYYYDIIKQN